MRLPLSKSYSIIWALLMLVSGDWNLITFILTLGSTGTYGDPITLIID